MGINYPIACVRAITLLMELLPGYGYASLIAPTHDGAASAVVIAVAVVELLL